MSINLSAFPRGYMPGYDTAHLLPQGASLNGPEVALCGMRADVGWFGNYGSEIEHLAAMPTCLTCIALISKPRYMR